MRLAADFRNDCGAIRVQLSAQKFLSRQRRAASRRRRRLPRLSRLSRGRRRLSRSWRVGRRPLRLPRGRRLTGAWRRRRGLSRGRRRRRLGYRNRRLAIMRRRRGRWGWRRRSYGRRRRLAIPIPRRRRRRRLVIVVARTRTRVARSTRTVIAAIFASFSDILAQLARRALHLCLGQRDEGLHRSPCIQQDGNAGTPGELGARRPFQIIERDDFLLQRRPLFKRISAVVLRLAVVSEVTAAPRLLRRAPRLSEGLERLAPLLLHFRTALRHEAVQ